MSDPASRLIDRPSEPPRKYLQEELLENVSDEIRLNGHYVILLILSTLIAALGLLTNSATVVIGAMLISPLFWPILGLTLSIITTKEHLAKRSTFNLAVSIVIILLLSFILAKISPLNQITSEISARTTPTLLDLFIALTTSAVGIWAIYDPRISQSISGVAISIALLPALCVSGIGIAFRSWEIFLGSFLLFATNMGAIIFVGAVTLYLLRFRPRKQVEKNRLRYGLLISFTFLFILSVPLSYFLVTSISQNRLISQIDQLLEQQLVDLVPNAQLDEVDIKFPPNLSHQLVSIEATVFLPEGYSLTKSEQTQIIGNLSTAIDRDIDLQLNLVSSLLLREEEDETALELKQSIRNFILRSLATAAQHIDYTGIDIRLPLNQEEDNSVEVLIELKELADSPITFQQKTALEASLESEFSMPFTVEVEFIPIRRLSQLSETERFQSQVTALLEEQLNLLGNLVFLADVKIEYDANLEDYQPEATSSTQVLGIQTAGIVATIYAPQDLEIPDSFRQEVERYITTETGIEVGLLLRFLRYETY